MATAAMPAYGAKAANGVLQGKSVVINEFGNEEEISIIALFERIDAIAKALFDRLAQSYPQDHETFALKTGQEHLKQYHAFLSSVVDLEQAAVALGDQVKHWENSRNITGASPAAIRNSEGAIEWKGKLESKAVKIRGEYLTSGYFWWSKWCLSDYGSRMERKVEEAKTKK